LKECVKDALPSASRIIRGEMMSYLIKMIYEQDIEQFHQQINEFQERYKDEVRFLDYFKKSWCDEQKMKIWSRAYHERQFAHVLTNYYIESWHNQLKTFFLNRSKNKCLDKLVFILTNDVEYYLKQEQERVLSNNGAMSSFTRQRRIREIEDERRNNMITAPIHDIGYSGGSCFWQVQSFVEDSTAYNVEVSETNLIISCTCFDYDTRRQPCKHMYLLNIHTKIPSIALCQTTTIISMQFLL
jgi:hypothetical protein